MIRKCSDQVYDPTVIATAQKDNEFETMSWGLVDNKMGSLVHNQSTQAGCAVGLVRNHEILYLKGYGYARTPHGNDNGEKWSVATMGAVGSVAKTITAVTALQMDDQKRMGI